MLALLCLLVQLPTVQHVLDRYVDATGGRDALLGHTSMTVHGRSQGLETILYNKGTKAVQKVLLPNGKAFIAGYDGTVAWSIDTAGQITIPQGDVVQTIARDADMYYHAHVLRYFKSMAVVDVKNFNGRPCYHLKGINNWGRLNEQFYDTATGLLRGYAFNTAWRGGKGDATATFEDYKSFGGVLLPTKTTGRDGEDVSVDLITSVTWDDVADSVFTLPPAVRARLEPKTGLRRPMSYGRGRTVVAQAARARERDALRVGADWRAAVRQRGVAADAGVYVGGSGRAASRRFRGTGG